MLLEYLSTPSQQWKTLITLYMIPQSIATLLDKDEIGPKTELK